MTRKPVAVTFHDDPNEGMHPFDPSPVGGPAEFDVSTCEGCGAPVGGYLVEDPYGREHARFNPYGAVEYDDAEFTFWCEDCWEPAAAALTVSQPRLAGPVDDGARLRDVAMARGDTAADPEWKSAADRCIEYLAGVRADFGFTSEDVLDRLDAAGLATHDNRALGSRFRSAAARGLIEKLGMEPSRRPGRHKAPIQRWRRPQE